MNINSCIKNKFNDLAHWKSGQYSKEATEFILPVLRMGKLFKILLVVGVVIVDAFMDTEMFPIFDRLESMAAVRTLWF